MTKAFTMAELIFVIIILGILAAISIPKLSATRDDAMIAKERANYKTCVKDLVNLYTTQGYLKDVNVTPGGIMTKGPDSCINLKCLVVDVWNDGHLGDFMIKKNFPRPPYCETFLKTQFPDTFNAVVLAQFTTEGGKVRY